MLTWINPTLYRWINWDAGRGKDLQRTGRTSPAVRRPDTRVGAHVLCLLAVLLFSSEKWMKYSCPWSIFLPLWRKSFLMLWEFPNQHFHKQLLLNPFILSLSNFLFYLHNADSFTFEFPCIGRHCCCCLFVCPFPGCWKRMLQIGNWGTWGVA